MKRIVVILLFSMALVCVAPLLAKTVGTSCSSQTSDYTVPTGARGLLFIFSSDFSGTINGVSWSGATDSSYSPPIQTGDNFAAVPITVSAGTVRVCVTK